MQSRGTSDQLQTNLSQILDSTRLMLGVLEAERQALTANDIAALDQAGARKQVLADTLEQLDQARTDLLCQYQAEHQRPQTMAAMLEACDASGELTSLWRAVQGSVRDCDRLNQVNGTALRVRRESVTRALGLLHGSPVTYPPLYDNSGSADSGSLPRSTTSLGRV